MLHAENENELFVRLDGAFVFLYVNVNLSKTTQSHALEHLGSIPCLGIRFVAWSVSVKHRQPPAIRNPLPLKKKKHEKPPTPTEVKLDVARREIERHEERIVQLQANVLRLEEKVKILSALIIMQ